MFENKSIKELSERLDESVGKYDGLVESVMNMAVVVADLKGSVAKLKKENTDLKKKVTECKAQMSVMQKHFDTFKAEFESVLKNTETQNEEERQATEAMMKILNFDPFNFDGDK